jgi:hypothetical protein
MLGKERRTTVEPDDSTPSLAILTEVGDLAVFNFERLRYVKANSFRDATYSTNTMVLIVVDPCVPASFNM